VFSLAGFYGWAKAARSGIITKSLSLKARAGQAVEAGPFEEARELSAGFAGQMAPQIFVGKSADGKLAV
jgi:hypothetical protein